MKCYVCDRPRDDAGTCNKCRSSIVLWIGQIPALHKEASDFITPGRSGSGAVTAERSIGVNVNALDFSMANELLGILHSWEAEIRSARHLTPPALLVKEKSVELEVAKACKFQLAHIDWTLLQEWAGDFVNEIKEQHAKGMGAAKRFVEQPRRIPCPTDDCGRFIAIDAERLMADVSCFKCKQSWTVLRLVALAMSNPNRRFYLDVEAIALWLGISQRQVYKIAKAANIEHKGSLYDLSAIIAAR